MQQDRARHAARHRWKLIRTVASGTGISALSEAAREVQLAKRSAAIGTPRRQLLDRLVLRLLLFEDSVSSLDAAEPEDEPFVRAERRGIIFSRRSPRDTRRGRVPSPRIGPA